MVDGMTAKFFHSYGFHLLNGTATIANSDFSHTGAPLFSAQGPWSLFVEAIADPTANPPITLTSSTTTYDVATPLAPCTITGPTDLPGVYSITSNATIAFH
jgi:hypothetical protein